MVDVRMRKNHVINFSHIESELPVQRVGFFAHALKHAAIQQDFFTVVQRD